jgi:hypothetical protein
MMAVCLGGKIGLALRGRYPFQEVGFSVQGTAQFLENMLRGHKLHLPTDHRVEHPSQGIRSRDAPRCEDCCIVERPHQAP